MLDIEYLQRDNKDLWKTFDMDQYFTKDNFLMLDFGCNQANFLRHAYKNTLNQPLRFQPKHYYGMDLNLASVQQGKINFPKTAQKILHYNKYHRSFNPTGNKQLRASEVIDKKFDVIVAYSVFTHCTVDETREILLDLRSMLTNRGSILFTMWTSDSLQGFYNYTMASTGLEKTAERQYNLVDREFKKCLYWIDLERSIADQDHVDLDQLESFGVFYKNVSSVMGILPCIEYLGRPDVSNQFQHLFRYGLLDT